MYKDIKEWVKSCTVCQTHGRITKHKEGKLAPIIATRPFQIMGMDTYKSAPYSQRQQICGCLYRLLHQMG